VSVNTDGQLIAKFDKERLREEWMPELVPDVHYAWNFIDTAHAAVQETVIFIQRHREAALTAAGFAMKEIVKFAGDLIKDYFKQQRMNQTNRLFLYGSDGEVVVVFEAKEGKVKRITARAKRRAATLMAEMKEEIASSLERFKK